jgi:hypothetical protein
MGLKGADVRTSFEEIENGVKGAIDYLRANLHVKKLANLPYPSLLVPLAVFFATSGSKGVKLTDQQRGALSRWFWKSCFSRRLSAGVLRNLKRDITEMTALRTKGTSSIDSFSASVSEDYFLEQSFTIGTVHTKTLILLLANKSPKSFISGAPVDLGPVLQAYNREEFHHLMPRSFLKTAGRTTAEINRLANFAIISADDNKQLGGVAPSIYKSKMPAPSIDGILEAALCPHSLFDDDYDAFIRARAKALTDNALALMAGS